MDKSIIVYRILTADRGDSIIFKPCIPFTKCPTEDGVTPRIPCARTIYDCLVSTEMASLINYDEPVLNLYIYSANIPIECIEEPTVNEVPDVWKTGELWCMVDFQFNKVGNATLRKHMVIPNTAYSRYMFTMEGFDEALDRICASPVYGSQYSFSFIDLDVERAHLAIEYAEQHREEYEC